MVEAWAELAIRGFVMVGLVSWQTINLSQRRVGRVAVGALLVNLVWYTNVTTAAITPAPYGGVAYAVGCSAGAVLAVWIGSRHFFGGRDFFA